MLRPQQLAPTDQNDEPQTPVDTPLPATKVWDKGWYQRGISWQHQFNHSSSSLNCSSLKYLFQTIKNNSKKDDVKRLKTTNR